MNPIELLEKQLKLYELALAKSNKMIENCIIDEKLHETHLINLLPLISEYKTAILKLKS